MNNTCCLISILPKDFKLNLGGSEIPFTISIHINTSTEPEKEYFFDTIFKSESLEKSKRIKIIVKENPAISNLKQMSGQISAIETKIKEYQKVGLNVANLQDLLEKIKGMVSESQSHITKDNINTLKTNENTVKLSLSQINDQLSRLAFTKIIYQNKWNIVSGIVITLLSIHLTTKIFIPYYRLGKEIIKLKFDYSALVKSRIETEKSYFLRKIDDKTFRTILSMKQSQIHNLTSQIKMKEQERYQALLQRLNPFVMRTRIKKILSKIIPKNQNPQL